MRIFLTVPFVFMATFATADTNDLIKTEGLLVAEAALSAQPDKTSSDQFALGAVRFLRGIEKTLQIRWKHNMVLADFDMPVLRLPVEPNPDAAPFAPALITALFSDLRSDMDASRAALDQVAGGDDVALNLNLMDLWFDVNMNARRDVGEGVIELGASSLMTRRARANMDDIPEAMLVRFDTADVAWLTAYTHLISGISELVVAFDPTQAITQVLEANEKMMALRGDIPMTNPYDGEFGGWVDQFAMVYGALNQQPVAENTRAAHGHFLEMIAENKVFWRAVAAEKDNINEWIPNKTQTAALGFELPADTSETWQALLKDAEDLLNGDLLVSYWRIAPVGGINLKKLFMDPPVVDIVTWIQGAGLLEYMEQGPTVTDTNFRRFSRMVSGDTLLFSLLFN
ncbi:MAG: hypothetical protein V3V13_08935 [Paracoccaceae bacterium]